MSSTESVTHWIHQVQAGDALAAQKLWEAYFPRLVGMARQKLESRLRPASDEEDVALSAFASFCRRAACGQFPLLSDRNDLWRLLVTITARKAVNQLVHDRRQKRCHELPRAAPALLEQVIGREPTPEFAAQVTEECQHLLDLLGDDNLRHIALWKMEGYTNEEIAGKLKCAVPTVERRLRVIRKSWEKQVQPPEEPHR